MQAGVPIMGTSPDSIDRAEDRKRCRVLLEELGLKQPESETALSVEEAIEVTRQIGFPVMIRPSYVLGGRAMMVAYQESDVKPFVEAAIKASPGHPVLIDRFLDRAVEIDVDCVCDGREVYIGGIMQHVEAAGVHSGDSACAIPPHGLSTDMMDRIEDAARHIALELEVKGLMNLQLAVKDDELYVIEINPRASRTVPYVSKATAVPLAKIAARICAGQTLKEIGLVEKKPELSWFAVKEAVFPFNRFSGVDPILGPEMKSTGEVMGIDRTFEVAYWKSQIAAGQMLPRDGMVFLSAKDADKEWMVEVGRDLSALGFEIVSTEGTGTALKKAGLNVRMLKKLAEKDNPNILDLMRSNEVHLLINTPSGPVGRVDETRIRSEAILRGVPLVTTEFGARATVSAIRSLRDTDWDVTALQDYHTAGAPS
jgi:carbamoyl-phosphate synthase large subunit